jgi:hypothetical protein
MVGKSLVREISVSERCLVKRMHCVTQPQIDVYTGLGVTHILSLDIEKQTRNQSENKSGHDIRKHRLTSSVFKDIFSRRANHDTLSVRLLKDQHIQTAGNLSQCKTPSVVKKAAFDTRHVTCFDDNLIKHVQGLKRHIAMEDSTSSSMRGYIHLG